MELLATSDHYIVLDGDHSLWCSRTDGSLKARKASDVNLKEAICLGVIYGIVGKFQVHSDHDKRLILIHNRTFVGHLPGGHEVYKIQKIATLPLTSQDVSDFSIEVCKKHHYGVRRTERSNIALEFQQKAFQKTWNTIKTATNQVKPRKLRDTKDKEKLEKRVLEELIKMFNDTDSFYFSPTGDLTNSLQRQYFKKQENANLPTWKQVDDRFFWNKHMMQELIDSGDDDADHWIMPIIQGFVQVEHCLIDVGEVQETIFAPEGNGPGDGYQAKFNDREPKEYTMIIISRRSRFRAGTRYKRRGVDENGKCANYVETEQIFEYPPHTVSFVQVRGSVPVFWSQPGYKYRPPPKLDRGEEETQVAFEKHFEEELSVYNSQVIISLLEVAGKERVVADAYLNHILNFNCPDLTYVTFDFHEYCRGMKFENVSLLIQSIKDIIRDMRYCWLDNEGLICDQRGTFRINCIDCLDRTNIVQTAIARTVMETQFIRLGLVPPEGLLPATCRRVFQVMWANNGDIISRQYAGTAALKGDFTRTGERRIAGVMKDGYNSASRYYVNRFKDAYRQATIDLMLGNPVTEDITALSPEHEEADVEADVQDVDHHERVKQLIEDCKKILIPESEVVLGGWALVDADPVTGDIGRQDMDIILMLTKDSYYVAEYDDHTDRITRYQRVLLEDLEKIELGPEPSLFKARHHCIRLHYLANGQSGYFHMFRSTNTRFFNNMAIPIKSEEEAVESLKAICETFKVALSVKSLNVPFFEGKLERRKSKMPVTHCGLSPNSFRHPGLPSLHLDLPSLSSMPRNISEGQLLSLKSVGTRALSNVTSQFQRLNPMRSMKGLGKWAGNGVHSGGTLATVNEPTALKQKAVFSVDSSSDSEDDSLRRLKKHNAPGFHAHISDRTLSSDYSECSDLDDQEAALMENGTENNNSAHDTLLESCGILATSPPMNSDIGGFLEDATFEDLPKQDNRKGYVDVDDFVLDAMKKASLRQYNRDSALCEPGGLSRAASQSDDSPPTAGMPPMPEIHVSSEYLSGIGGKSVEELSTSLLRTGQMRKLSKSSEDLEVRSFGTACSAKDVSRLMIKEEAALEPDNMSGKMKTSHSETAIQDYSMLSLNLPNPLSSPIVIKKDLVLSPLSRIAKGMQTLGMNLRPNNRQRPHLDPEEFQRLKERKKNCQTRIIEL